MFLSLLWRQCSCANAVYLDFCRVPLIKKVESHKSTLQTSIKWLKIICWQVSKYNAK